MEWYVVWLKVEFMYAHKDDFGADTDAALVTVPVTTSVVAPPAASLAHLFGALS
jgi:hypothetical protein